ncbi:Microtubule bundling protein [Saxophila tyrrhenica]|uniref:Microtubule bundling protein n=1 Tax=Saxophila tyrrhenica TaxID=1690608 RepID=A0AAV9P4J2_9PEZI|nr:Microtubule bundling protein [Saxophila tyrrhenica]
MDTSYLSQQVTTIIERLHGFFDEIGVASHERDSRESELFSALSETLHNQLNIVAKEKHDLTEEAQRLIKTIRQMERSLDDSGPDDDYESERDGLKVSFPLLDCIQHLKDKHHTISKLHRERYEQVKKLVEALESYASHLEPSFVSIKLPPTSPNAKVPPNFDLSPTYVGKLDNEFTRVYEEYNRRISTVGQIADEIINLWSELGTPQAQVESHIVQYARESPEQLGLHADDLKRLTSKRDKLVSEKSQRERRLKELRTNIEGLWDRLGIEASERKQFLSANRGCGLRTINEFEDELSRLNELKRQNLHLFVEDARFKLQELWDNLYFSEEEMLDFAPAFSDVYSDALLSAHEQEITRLETLKEQRAPILAAVDKHRSLIKDRDDLEKSSLDASRLMAKGPVKGEKRDPGKLLREEKMRKRIAKDLPKVEADLRKTLEAWEDEYGRPFCVHGERYLDELEMNQAKAKAPPARSKTPNALQPAREAPKSAGKSQPPSRNGTVRGAPPPRSKTPTAMAGRNPMAASTMSSSVMGSSMSSSQRTSPSKIPGASRLPMSTLRDGNNSPERRLNGAKSHADLSKTVRGGMGPPKAPPPKMKDLFVPPTPTHEQENPHELERSASVVRHVEPEDPYDDRHHQSRPYQHHQSHHQQMHSSTMGPPPPIQRPTYPRSDASYTTTSSGRPLSRSDYPRAPPSRQTSNTSSLMSGSVASGVSGSENWETYTDQSDAEEADATEAYWAKVKAQQGREYHGQAHGHGYAQGYAQGAKRPAPMGGRMGEMKRVREESEREGSEAWTDEGDVGDTY